MAYEYLQLKNLAQGTLISDSSSTIKVAGDLPYSLPVDVVNGPFMVTVDDEILKVTDVNTDINGHYDYDVIRAQEDTAYTSHSPGQKIFLNVTAGTINHIQDYLSLIDTTSNIDLNTIYNDTQTNNAKVTNANHTGDVTGSDVLGIVPAAISGRSEVTPANGDYVLLFDATDNTLKKSLVDTFITGGGGGGDITGPATSVLNSLAIFDTTTGDSITDSNIILTDSGNSLEIPGAITVEKEIRNSIQHTLGSSGSVTWNINDYPIAKITPTGNITLTIDHSYVNSNATLYFKQNDTTPYTIDWGNNVFWAGDLDPDLSSLDTEYLFNFFAIDTTNLMGAYISNSNRIAVEHVGGSVTIGSIPVYDSTNGYTITDSIYNFGDISGLLSDVNIIQSDITGIQGDIISLNSDVSGLQNAGYITTDSTNVLTNKLIVPRKVTLNSAAEVNWNSSHGSLFTCDITGNVKFMADSNTSPNDGQIAEFRLYSSGSGAQPAYDTTSSSRAFRFSDDLTGEGLLSVNKYMYVLTQYNSPSQKWDVISKNEGF